MTFFVKFLFKNIGVFSHAGSMVSSRKLDFQVCAKFNKIDYKKLAEQCDATLIDSKNYDKTDCYCLFWAA